MSHTRLIYEDTPAFIPVPKELLHRKTEIIILSLEEEATVPSVATSKGRVTDSHDEQWLNCNGESIIPGKQNFPDLSEFHKTLPRQEMSAGQLCRSMRDEDRY